MPPPLFFYHSDDDLRYRPSSLMRSSESVVG